MVDILEEKRKGIAEKKTVLTNKKTGEMREYILRTFRPGDEEGIRLCVQEEHGTSYFKKFFYDLKLLKEKTEGDEYIVFVAEENNEIAGVEILRIFGKEGDDYIEPASQMIRKSHRGFGLSGALVNYTFFVARSLKPSALFVHTAMYHTITQHVCEAYGMEPIGYEIGSFLTEIMQNSYFLEGIKKYSAGTLCYPVEKRNAREIYLPTELASYGKKVYEKINVPCRIFTEHDVKNMSELTGEHKLFEDSKFIISKENEINRYITIDVKKVGDDFYEKIKEIMSEHVSDKKNPDGWVYHLIMDIDTPEFIEQYKRLKNMGFFVGSIQPVCGIHERVFLYWLGDLELHMEQYVVTEKFDEVRKYISNFYEKRVMN